MILLPNLKKYYPLNEITDGSANPAVLATLREVKLVLMLVR
jgi:hypothetical protein